MKYLDKAGLSRLWANLKPKLTGKEDKSNKVTSITSTSTDNQYPSAKAVYNLFNNETVLYDNSTGSIGTITLSDSSANYKYLEIYYKKSGIPAFTKIYNPNGKGIFLTWVQMTDAKLLQIVAKKININDSTITVDTSKSGFANLSNSGTFITTLENEVFITRVVGYK